MPDPTSSRTHLDDGGPAFPCNRTVGPTNGTVEDFRAYGTGEEGMTLRDYFAAKAMLSMLWNVTDRDGFSSCDWNDERARLAYL